MQKSQSVNPVTTFILATWRQWAFSLGLIILLVALSPIVSRFFIAYVAFAFAFILGVRIYIDHTKPNQGLALPFICTITLFLTGILITTFNITDRITGFYELAGHEFNDELPQIVQLAVAPMLALTSGIFILKRLGRRGRSSSPEPIASCSRVCAARITPVGLSALMSMLFSLMEMLYASSGNAGRLWLNAPGISLTRPTVTLAAALPSVSVAPAEVSTWRSSSQPLVSASVTGRFSPNPG